MHERRFHGELSMLRSPGQVALLEVERVVKLCLAEFAARRVLYLMGIAGDSWRGWAVAGK